MLKSHERENVSRYVRDVREGLLAPEENFVGTCSGTATGNYRRGNPPLMEVSDSCWLLALAAKSVQLCTGHSNQIPKNDTRMFESRELNLDI